MPASTAPARPSPSPEPAPSCLNDVATFRTFFDLPATPGPRTSLSPATVRPSPCTDLTDFPSHCALHVNDLLENSLDVEWSGAVAKNAQIVLVATYPTPRTDDNLYDSESYIVNHRVSARHERQLRRVRVGPAPPATSSTTTCGRLPLLKASRSSWPPATPARQVATQGGDFTAFPIRAVWPFRQRPRLHALQHRRRRHRFQLVPPSQPSPRARLLPYWSTPTTGTPPMPTPPRAAPSDYVPEVPWNDTCTSPGKRRG